MAKQRSANTFEFREPRLYVDFSLNRVTNTAGLLSSAKILVVNRTFVTCISILYILNRTSESTKIRKFRSILFLSDKLLFTRVCVIFSFSFSYSVHFYALELMVSQGMFNFAAQKSDIFCAR